MSTFLCRRLWRGIDSVTHVPLSAAVGSALGARLTERRALSTVARGAQQLKVAFGVRPAERQRDYVVVLEFPLRTAVNAPGTVPLPNGDLDVLRYWLPLCARIEL